MKMFSWKKIATLCGVVLGGGLISFVLSGLLPVAVMPLKLLLFFTSLGAVAFVGTTFVAQGVMQYQQSRQNKIENERIERDRLNEVLDSLYANDLTKEEEAVVRIEQKQHVKENKRATKEQTPLDEVFEKLSTDTAKMKNGNTKEEKVEQEKVEKNEEEGLEI